MKILLKSSILTAMLIFFGTMIIGCTSIKGEKGSSIDTAPITEEMLDPEVSYEISKAQYDMSLDDFLEEEIAVSIGPDAIRRYRCACKKDGKTICYINTNNNATAPCSCRSGWGYKQGFKGSCKRI